MRKPARGATLDEIESIYRTRLPDFRRVAAAILGDRELALDAVQEGFALAVRERSSFRGDGPLEAWLWRIIVNAANPGEPASESDQRAFDAENERTWARFPDGLQLRRVIVTEAAGGTFELFGFRSGYSLCLRLTVEGIPSEGASTGCAPLSELRHAEAPALALYLDAGFGHQDVPGTEEGYVPPRASATFGVVADGVSAVALRTSEGPVETIVENNAFLAVTVDPPLGLRTKELTAIGERGERVSVAIAESPFGDYGPQAKPGVAPGPRAVERRVEGGTVGWLVRREPRGQSLTEAGIERDAFFLRMGTLRYARVLT
ncbi:MAG: RNA polymerase sigma factor, partial [Gaiellaceae bacterium]